MQQTFADALGAISSYTAENVRKAIKALNAARWERLLLLLEYIEDQGELSERNFFTEQFYLYVYLSFIIFL